MEELKKALELKHELDALRPIDAEREAIIMQKFRLDWNYHSNHLEGNTLTYGETKALLLFNITAQGKPLKDHIEVTGHNEAINWVLDLVKGDRPFSESFIRQIHTLLLKEPYEVDALTPDGKPTKKKVHVGEYKKTPNHVKTVTGEIFRFATPEETPSKMTDLLNWYRSKTEEETINPILVAAEFHYRFIRIHPFDDGNGRTARIIMNFILMKYGFPPTIIKTEDKENYFAALRLADAGNIEAFINYIAENLVYSLELMISGAKGEIIEEDDDLEKELKILEKRLEYIDKKKDLYKSNILVFDIINNSISILFEKLKKKQIELFKSFYGDYDFTVSLNGDIDKIPTSLEELDFYETLDSLQILIVFKKFKSDKFELTFFYQKIIIEFSELTYKLTFGDNLIMKPFFEKNYGIQLKEDEINSIVKKSVLYHKNYIEEKIKQKENSRK